VVQLRDDHGTEVEVDCCPLEQNWEQERFLQRWLDEELGGHPPMAWLDTPSWIAAGANVIAHIRLIERLAEQSRGGCDV
jgi:hypothetical protein